MDPWGYMQNPFHRLRVRHSYAYFEATIFQICSAVFLKKCHLSILAFHKYHITSFSPVFHTGILELSRRVQQSIPWGKFDPKGRVWSRGEVWSGRGSFVLGGKFSTTLSLLCKPKLMSIIDRPLSFNQRTLRVRYTTRMHSAAHTSAALCVCYCLLSILLFC